MTKKKSLLFIGGLLIIIVLIMVFINLAKNKNQQEITENVIEASRVIPHLKDGDVILRLGDGALSSTFRNVSLTDKRFSHLGIVRIRDNNITIINSVGNLRDRSKGVREDFLDFFLEYSKSLGIFRVKSIDGAFISDKAAEYIDHPFDWGFNLDNDRLIYCTELLYAILKQAGSEDILEKRYVEQIKKDVIPLESITQSSGIDEIMYIEK